LYYIPMYNYIFIKVNLDINKIKIKKALTILCLLHKKLFFNNLIKKKKIKKIKKFNKKKKKKKKINK